MKLQDFIGTGLKSSFQAVAGDKQLTTQIQTRLIMLGLLEPPADGQFGPITTAALKKFQNLMRCDEIEYLGPVTAKRLIEAKLEDIPKEPLKLGNNLASRIIKYLQVMNYQIFQGPRQYNIVYIEGMDSDGTVNSDAPNYFNDRRMVIQILEGIPYIIGNWEGTTEPGYYYTYYPMNEKGAARIKFGQYKAWQVGLHGNYDTHEALVQVAPITVHRDFNQDLMRTGDKLDTGLFAINQHWGYGAIR